jgi:hypothetical protein
MPASPSTASSPGTLKRALEDALVAVDGEQRALAALDRSRLAALTDAERVSLGQIARNLPRLWNAKTTTQRDRKELLRTLVHRSSSRSTAKSTAPTSRCSGKAAREPSCNCA